MNKIAIIALSLASASAFAAPVQKLTPQEAAAKKAVYFPARLEEYFILLEECARPPLEFPARLTRV